MALNRPETHRQLATVMTVTPDQLRLLGGFNADSVLRDLSASHLISRPSNRGGKEGRKIQKITKAYGIGDQRGVWRIPGMPDFGLDQVPRDTHAEEPPRMRRSVVGSGMEQVTLI